MPTVVAEIKRSGAPKVLQEEVQGEKMSDLITSVKAVKQAMNDLLSAIVEEEAASSGTTKAQNEKAPPEEEECSDESEENDNDTSKKRQKL